MNGIPWAVSMRVPLLSPGEEAEAEHFRDGVEYLSPHNLASRIYIISDCHLQNWRRCLATGMISNTQVDI